MDTCMLSSMRTSLDDATRRDCSASFVLGASYPPNTTRTHPYRFVVYCLYCYCWMLPNNTMLKMTTVNSTYCCRWWLAAAGCQVIYHCDYRRFVYLPQRAITGCARSTNVGMSVCRHGCEFLQNSRKSTCSSDVTQATPPKVSIPSITRDAAGIELTHLGIYCRPSCRRCAAPTSKTASVFRERIHE